MPRIINKDIDNTTNEVNNTVNDESTSEPKVKVKSFNEVIAEERKKAFELVKVRITNLDPSENAVMKSVYASVENPYFSISKVIPLNTPVQIERALINNIRSMQLIIHTPTNNDSLSRMTHSSKYAVEELKD